MHPIDIDDLINRYNKGTCSADEIALLEAWYADWNRDKPLAIADEQLLEDLVVNRKNVLTQVISPTKSVKLWPRLVGVAAASAAILAGIWFYNATFQNSGTTPEQMTASHDIPAGKNTATLTLSNGKTITLSDAKTGVVMGDQLRYNDHSAVLSDAAHDLENADMTLNTPRGGTYQITLSDGTKIWLNAASTLTYNPVLNKAGQRKVKLEGEAYFEVAKDKLHPFIVESKGQQVKVLGTHFNINSYPDEPLKKTTLLEGSVSINGTLLKPNQQAVLNGTSLKVKPANIEGELAWKNGDFLFDGEDFPAAMRKVARWYDVEIVYDASVPQQIKLGGWVSRSKNLSVVLKVLESTGEIHFKVKGRRVIVEK